MADLIAEIGQIHHHAVDMVFAWRVRVGPSLYTQNLGASTLAGPPRVLMEAISDPDAAAAKRAFEAMMTMTKIDIAKIEAARRG